MSLILKPEKRRTYNRKPEGKMGHNEEVGVDSPMSFQKTSTQKKGERGDPIIEDSSGFKPPLLPRMEGPGLKSGKEEKGLIKTQGIFVSESVSKNTLIKPCIRVPHPHSRPLSLFISPFGPCSSVKVPLETIHELRYPRRFLRILYPLCFFCVTHKRTQ